MILCSTVRTRNCKRDKIAQINQTQHLVDETIERANAQLDEIRSTSAETIHIFESHLSQTKGKLEEAKNDLTQLNNRRSTFRSAKHTTLSSIKKCRRKTQRQ